MDPYWVFAAMCWLVCILVWLPPRALAWLEASWIGRAWDAIRSAVEWVLTKLRVIR